MNSFPEEENKAPLKRPLQITVGTCAVIVLFAILFTFMTTYICLTCSFSEKRAEKAQYAEGMSELEIALQKLSQIDASLRNEFLYEPDEEALAAGVLKGYMYSLGDRYAEYYTKEEFAALMSDTNGEMEGIGIYVTENAQYNAIEILTVFPGSPALEAGVQPGDLIAYVKYEDEMKSVSEIGYTVAVDALLGKAGTKAEFIVARGENYAESVEFAIERGFITEYTVSSRLYDADKTVGIVKINSFDAKTPEQFKAAVEELLEKGAKSLIFDVRYNPGGELESVCSVLDMLVGEGPIIRTVDRAGNETVEEESGPEELNVPMAVLMNSGTASAGELFSACLKDYEKAVLVGENTYGKGSMQTIHSFADGTGYKFTYRYYCPPFSDNFDGVGIKPDVESVLDLESIGNFYTMSDEDDTQLIDAYNALKKQ